MDRKRSRWCYASGCTGRDMCYTLVALFFISYIQYTNLVNTPQFLVLTGIIVLCRVWDAVNDPMMGTVISNTRSRLGKYRPWILSGSLMNAAILILMFTLRVDVGDDIDTLGWYNVALLGVLYLLWGMSYTVNDVSYWSLLPVLAEEKKDRDGLTTMVTVFASVGAFVAGGIIPVLTPGNMVAAYRNIAISFAAVFVLCQTMVFFFTHDNSTDTFKMTEEEFSSLKKEKSITLRDMFRILTRNGQLLVMALTVLLYTAASAFLTAFGQNFFYFKYGYDGNRVFIFTVIYAVGTLISQGIYPLVAAKFRRKQIVDFSVALAVFGYVLFIIFATIDIPPAVSFSALGAAALLVFAGQGLFYMAMLIMLANTIEYDEWKTGERNDAVIFSVRPFMVKLSGALESLTVSLVLVLCGLYPIINRIGAVETGIDKGLIAREEGIRIIGGYLSTATDGQMLGLTLAMTVIPVILLVICRTLLKRKYVITEEMYEKMTSEIKARRQA